MSAITATKRPRKAKIIIGRIAHKKTSKKLFGSITKYVVAPPTISTDNT